MAYNPQCVALWRSLGPGIARAAAAKRAAYASAASYEAIGLRGRANQIRKQADRTFAQVRDNALEHAASQGC